VRIAADAVLLTACEVADLESSSASQDSVSATTDGGRSDASGGDSEVMEGFRSGACDAS
jgi:hypothetical protein